ncbi:hypothetical protein SB521682_1237 [Shigella boydii 5216-82]|nr:hypothetical protein SB521682_1237 [Shigella boydii 5216-82]
MWIYLLAIKMDLFFFLPGGGDVLPVAKRVKEKEFMVMK